MTLFQKSAPHAPNLDPKTQDSPPPLPPTPQLKRRSRSLATSRSAALRLPCTAIRCRLSMAQMLAFFLSLSLSLSYFHFLNKPPPSPPPFQQDKGAKKTNSPSRVCTPSLPSLTHMPASAMPTSQNWPQDQVSVWPAPLPVVRMVILHCWSPTRHPNHPPTGKNISPMNRTDRSIKSIKSINQSINPSQRRPRGGNKKRNNRNKSQ